MVKPSGCFGDAGNVSIVDSTLKLRDNKLWHGSWWIPLSLP
jgi:hypothetical protein